MAVIFHIKLMQGVCKHLILIGCPHGSRNYLVLLKLDPVISRIVHEHVQGRSGELYIGPSGTRKESSSSARSQPVKTSVVVSFVFHRYKTALMRSQRDRLP